MSDDGFDFEDRNKQLASEESRRLSEAKDRDLRDVLAIPGGRRFLWDQMGESGVFHESFTSNANQTAFNEGKRSRGLKLLADILRIEPDRFLQMQKEQASLAKQRNVERKQKEESNA